SKINCQRSLRDCGKSHVFLRENVTICVPYWVALVNRFFINSNGMNQRVQFAKRTQSEPRRGREVRGFNSTLEGRPCDGGSGDHERARNLSSDVMQASHSNCRLSVIL